MHTKRCLEINEELKMTMLFVYSILKTIIYHLLFDREYIRISYFRSEAAIRFLKSKRRSQSNGKRGKGNVSPIKSHFLRTLQKTYLFNFLSMFFGCEKKNCLLFLEITRMRVDYNLGK